MSKRRDKLKERRKFDSRRNLRRSIDLAQTYRSGPRWRGIEDEEKRDLEISALCREITRLSQRLGTPRRGSTLSSAQEATCLVIVQTNATMLAHVMDGAEMTPDELYRTLRDHREAPEGQSLSQM